jgi:hemolysin activation/secretion protein
MAGSVFNLRDAEQGIDQLNRLGTNDARIDIRPGSTPGSSVLVILNQPRRRATGTFSSDNTGSSATGEWQGTLTASVDDLFNLNDGFFVTHTRSIDDPEGPAASRSTSVNYSVPYGWWTATASFSQSNYDTVVQGITRDFVTSGTSDSASLRVERVALRDQARKLTLYAGLNRRDSENFVADQLIDASSRVLTSLSLESNLSVVSGASLWSFDAGVFRGVTWFGALDDAATLADGAPRAQYLKFTAGGGVSRGFEALGVRAQVSSRLTGQWSNDTLYASEQLALAGPFSVRGYRDSRLYGDRGLTWRNELAVPFTVGAGAHTPLGVRPFLGADYGKVWAHGAAEGGSLSGWTAGVGLNYAPMSLQLSFSGAGPRSASVPSDHMFFARLAAGF